MTFDIVGIFDQSAYEQKLVKEWNGSTDPKDMIGFYTTKNGFIVAATHVTTREDADKNLDHPHTDPIDTQICRLKPTEVCALFGQNHAEITKTLETKVNDLEKVVAYHSSDNEYIKRRTKDAATPKQRLDRRLYYFKDRLVLRYIDFSDQPLRPPLP